MSKFICILLALVAVCNAKPSYGVSSLTNVVSIPLNPTTVGNVLTGQNATSALIQYLLTGLDTGATLNFPGLESFKLGLVSLPIYNLCVNGDIPRQLACRICSLDCTYVHNKYGGQCGADSATAGTNVNACKCNDAPVDNSIPTTLQSCGNFLGSDADSAIDYAIQTAALVRETAILCLQPPTVAANGTGCGQDCINNHVGYSGGSCQTATTVSADGSNTNSKNYCICQSQ